MSAFAIPSQNENAAEAALLSRGEAFNGLGQRLVVHPDHVGADNPKLVGYTRATSYISAIEDSTALQKWRTRLILEGASDAGLESGSLTAYNRYLSALHEVEQTPQAELDAMTKTARTALLDAPGKAYRAELDELAERAFFLAGGRDQADYGTALHELADRWHNSRLGAAFLAETEDRWPGIARDFAAYQAAWLSFAEKTGANIVRTEALVVHDGLKVAGRTDLIVSAKLPGDERSRRVIADIKTGKISGELKLSQQLAMYAGSKLYDPESGARTSARLRQDVGIVIHVPKGEARAEMHLVQLAPGRAANKLCEKIRASRRRVPGLLTPLQVAL